MICFSSAFSILGYFNFEIEKSMDIIEAPIEKIEISPSLAIELFH